ncbi:Glyoxylate reductase 1 [Nakaseomyces bracarensis]|uniref:Glyoxylate reductase 1 n=1 Tax=Nakaseomyces bracarensis TaxID=273131 RepID=A0ABR4NQC8_9SACH
MSKPIILRLGSLTFAQPQWAEVEKIADVITVDSSMTRDQFLEELKDPQSKFSKINVITRTAGSVAQTGLFDKEIADALPSSVIAICHTGAGYDQIQVQHFKERHIQVANVPDIVSNATADAHVFLLLGSLRNFAYGHHNMLAGEWKEATSAANTPFGNDPEGKVVGILGMGRIGRAISDRLRPFGFEKIIYHNRHRLPEAQENGCEYVGSIDDFYKQADVISVNIPLNANTTHLINKDSFEKMKDGVIIVNTARGPIIDEKALINALKSGKVRAAGLDVFEDEPHVPKELLDMPQVLSTPHMGTHCVETRWKMEKLVLDNAISALKTGKVKTLVPEMQGEEWVNDVTAVL